MERRLGRGLGSLLSEPSKKEPRRELGLDEIKPNPFQPRKTFDARALEELQTSIQRHGVLQPVVVRVAADGYELISGERRWRASRLAGRTSVPAVVREDVADEQMLELALVENVQRRDLDAIEKARGYRQMIEGLGLTQDQVAGMVGLQRSTVSNHLRLLELPETAQKALVNGVLSMGHARALLGLKDSRAQEALLEETVRQGLSVRAVEDRVRMLAGRTVATPTKESDGGSRASASPAWVQEAERRLRESLGTRVRIQGTANRGCLMVEYFDQDGLDRLLSQLAPKKTL